MHKKTRNRLIASLLLLLCIGSGVYLVLYFLSDNIVFFIKPSEISVAHMSKKIRIGGLVEPGSIKHGHSNLVEFMVSDGKKSIKVEYKGILPALFRESQGIVAEGKLNSTSDIFYAQRLLTKHDENYKPPK